MKIAIREPAPFFSNGDEDSFFHWLKSIDAVKDFVGSPRGLEVTLEDPVEDLSLRELIGLLTRYGLDMRCLRGLRTQQNEAWFADEQMLA
ncbi:hypothetical protein N2603_33255 [Bradyrhizobium huanghuaihaiense]|uniref:hypothetical protein n=1 Tax=Bradyrhizobium huanghuaihaiense TaxID=990078 RepID=UPI0021AA6240|nr:hypothetical protein [Bradyrhizobium sp. CB3035]UWU74882.1 hypothetical protein N2603_33255 [Bradyrhizobium sp. CB3035]